MLLLDCKQKTNKGKSVTKHLQRNIKVKKKKKKFAKIIPYLLFHFDLRARLSIELKVQRGGTGWILLQENRMLLFNLFTILGLDGI